MMTTPITGTPTPPSRLVAVAAACLLAVVTTLQVQSLTPAHAATGSVVVVVKSPGAPSAGESAVRARLVAAGHAVTLADDNAVVAADVASADLVLISSTVSDSVLGSRLAGVSVPVWVAKPYLLDNYGLAGAGAGTAYGTRPGGAVDVTDPTHPAAAGRSGAVAFQAAGQQLSFGRSPTSAHVVATTGGEATVYAVSAGDLLAGGSAAPACRLTFPLVNDAPTTFTADAWAMFDATAAWAVAGCEVVPPTPSDTSVAYLAGAPGALSAQEQWVIDRIAGAGHDVAVLDDTTVTPAAVAGTDLVVVGHSVNPGTLGDKLLDTSVPVWIAKPYSLPRFQVTGPTAGTDYGDKPGRTWVVSGGHPMAADRSGTLAAYSETRRVSWGRPVSEATVVATADGSPTVFTVPAGATLASGGNAAGCRFTFPLFALGPTSMTTDARAMFDAAVEWGVGGCGSSDPPVTGVEHVVVVSIDGLNPQALATLGAAGAPTIFRLEGEGVSTRNARSSFDETETLPNHISMVTGRRVALPGGHGVTFNEDNQSTVHNTAGEYVTSAFDVVHDRGGSTALYAGKPKFGFLNRSWNGTNGAPDTVGADNGRDKIDTYLQVTSGATSTDALVTDIGVGTLADLTVLHLAEPDQAGHASGYLSPAYLAALTQTDTYLGQVVDALAGSPTHSDDTVLVVTSDHGGTGTVHSDATLAVNYTIPFLGWGPGVAAGQDLYALNPTRLDPGTGRPADAATSPPVRNGDVANLATDLLGLPSVPGSMYGPGQDIHLAP